MSLTLLDIVLCIGLVSCIILLQNFVRKTGGYPDDDLIIIYKKKKKKRSMTILGDFTGTWMSI